MFGPYIIQREDGSPQRHDEVVADADHRVLAIRPLSRAHRPTRKAAAVTNLGAAVEGYVRLLRADAAGLEVPRRLQVPVFGPDQARVALHQGEARMRRLAPAAAPPWLN